MQGKDLVTWGILIWIGWQIYDKSGGVCPDASCNGPANLQAPPQGPAWLQCEPQLQPFIYEGGS